MKFGRSQGSNSFFNVSRRRLITGLGAAGGLMLAPGFPKTALAFDDDDDHEPAACVGPNPIPGGTTALKPFGIFVHHNPLNPAVPLDKIHDPSQITDFDGFVGLTNIHGEGTGTNTNTGETMTLAFRADMGFSQGKFVGTDGRVHRGTQVFV